MVQCLDRIIASMDTGVDDALALAYLLGSADECELSGVIASYGNVDANTAYANTRAVLDLFGRADIRCFWALSILLGLMRSFLMQGVPSSMGMMDWGILGWQGPELWLMELVCLAICLGMTCLWMCPMGLFLLAGIWQGTFMLIRRWGLILVWVTLGLWTAPSRLHRQLSSAGAQGGAPLMLRMGLSI